MFSAVATVTSSSSYQEGEVLVPRKRGEHLPMTLQLINSYIYILWLLLHVFSSGDYDLPQVPIIIQCRFKKQLCMYIYIMIIIACFQQWRLWPAPSTNHYSMSFQETAVYIYILWLSLHVFSSGDYDLPQVPIIIQCRFKKQLLYIHVYIYIYYDYLCMFSAVATVTESEGEVVITRKRGEHTNDTTIDKQLYIYILWLLLPVFSSGDMTCPKYQSLFNVVSRNSYMYIYILWLSLHVFSSGDYDLPQVPIIIQCRFKKQLLYIHVYIYILLWLFMHVFSSGDYDLPQVQIIIQCRFKKQLCIYIYIMIIIACFQQWRLWPAPSTNHYSMSFQETAMYIYIYYDYHCMFSAVATMTCPKYQSLFNVVSRNSYIYIYILWLSLHVFSSGDYDLPQVPIIIQCRFKKQLLYILWLFIHVFSSGDYDLPQVQIIIQCRFKKQLYIYIYYDYHCMFSAVATMTCPKYQSLFNVVSRNSYVYIYILWLSLHVFSSGDYDLPQVPIIIQCRFKKQLQYMYIYIYILWLFMHVFSCGDCTESEGEYVYYL